MKKFLIVCNPVSGKGAGEKYLPTVIKEIKENNIPHIIKVTEYKLDAQNNIKSWIDDSITDILVIGGDGTLNEVINGLYPNLLPIRLVNAGTGNDMIRSLGTIPFHDLFIKNEYQTIDLFSVNNLIGINALGIGFDGEVVDAMEKNKLPIRGFLAYFIFVVKNLFSFAPPLYEVTVDNKNYKGNFFINTTGNGKAVGGGFYLTPFAELNDGLLDICLIENVSAILRPYFMMKVIKQHHINDKRTLMLKGKYINIKSSKIVKAQLDGQLMESDHFEIKVIPSKLKIMSSII